jgi:hypothetical protein
MGASEGRRTNHWPCDGLAAVTATGVIWSRYSMVITPKNWNLFAVNVFMAGTGLVQFYRKFTCVDARSFLTGGLSLG